MFIGFASFFEFNLGLFCRPGLEPNADVLVYNKLGVRVRESYRLDLPPSLLSFY